MNIHNGIHAADSGASALSELAELVAGLEFDDQQAACRSGRSWIVYVHPWAQGDSGTFNALISLHPRSSGAGTARGVRLTLFRENIVWLTNDVVDERGHLWFRGLPAGMFCVAAGIEPGTTGTVVRQEIPGGPMEAELAAQSLGPGPDSRVVRGWKLFHLPDRRVTALLEENYRCSVSLLLSTGAQDLAGAEVRFAIGNQAGTTILVRDEFESRWTSRLRLDGDFAALAALIPHFEIFAVSSEAGPPTDDNL